MKACLIGAAILIVVTLICSFLEAANPRPKDILPPIAGCIVTSAVLIGLMSWENQATTKKD